MHVTYLVKLPASTVFSMKLGLESSISIGAAGESGRSYIRNYMVLLLCMDFVFGILDLGVTYLVQGPCNQIDFELPCCKCLLQHLICECFGLGTAVIGGSLRNEF